MLKREPVSLKIHWKIFVEYKNHYIKRSPTHLYPQIPIYKGHQYKVFTVMYMPVILQGHQSLWNQTGHVTGPVTGHEICGILMGSLSDALDGYFSGNTLYMYVLVFNIMVNLS